MIKDINLQLFADGEEIDEIELEEEVETEEEAEVETEAETEVEAEEPAKPKNDKVTAAIIREKQENKKLRDKLAALEKEKASREQTERYSKLKQKLIDDGLSEQEAEDGVSDRREREELKRDLRDIKYGQQADKLASKYPDIHEHLESFIGIVETSKGAITLAELCKAKLDESTTHEIRTKAEQEALLTKNKAKDKQIKTGDVKADTPVKLSVDDERVLASINKKKQAQGLPLMSKKQYLELSI